MPRSEGPIRHLAYFQTLASLDEGGSAWRAASAGLVVLRLIDRWLDDADGDLAASVEAVRAAVLAMDEGDQSRTLLLSVADAVAGAAAPTTASVAPRLMAYGRALDFRGEWALAEDVYRTIVSHAHAVFEPDVAIDANMRLGYCARMRSNLDEATAAYDRAGRIAQAAGDVVKALHAQIGHAKLAMERGNLPDAERILDTAIRRARSGRFDGVGAIALHDRAHVAYHRRDFERAVRYAYEALGKTAAPAERDRVLSDIASFFVELGVRSSARDAFIVLAATAQEQFVRWTASINLMELASFDGQEDAFEQYRRELASAALPPIQLANFHLHVGQAHGRVGRTAAAERALREAVSVAEAHQFNQLVFAAERALAELAAERPPAVEAAREAPRSLLDVVDAVSAMRRDATVVM